jgi:Domain of unknown function (DUF6484)
MFAATPGIVIGRLLAGSASAAPLVDFPGNGEGPLRARTTLVLDAATVDRAVVTGQGATLVFENGDPRLPIVTGLVQTDQAATPFQELLVSARPTANVAGARPGRQRMEARLDGERVVLEGKKEVILKCGEASITLRSDGRMVLRGTYVETYAKGVNRIKGGSVKIN